MHKRKQLFWFVIIASLVILCNYFLLKYFNTLVWPYLWPRPLVFILVAIFVIGFWLREYFTQVWMLRVFGAAMVFIGECYVLHSLEVMLHDFSIISLIHFVGIMGTFVVMVLSYVNQFMPKDRVEPPPLPDVLLSVAVVVPTYGEPVDVLEQTLLSIKELDYPEDRLHIVVSDDSHRAQVLALTERLGVHYNFGPRRNAKAGNLNSALNYLDIQFPKATLILTQDADEIIHPEFLKRTVGYFSDPEIAFVQTPKDAIAPRGDPFGVRDRVFYDRVQAGRNGANAAFSCGSGVLWRIEAVKSIGGFATWNIVEDLTTSYFLHSAGWKSEYHNEILTIGLAPDDIPGLLKQRGTWAVDTWRLFLFKNPLRQRGLTLRQRLQYTELGLFYVTSSFFMPLLMLTPLLSLLTGRFVPIEGSALFPWVTASLLYYIALSGSTGEFLKRMWQYWIGHFATYHKAFWIAIRSRRRKPSYKVTRKTRQSGFYGWMVWHQYLYLIIGAVAIIHGLFGLPEVNLAARLTNIAILLFFMYMVSGIVRASLYGVQLPIRLPRLSVGRERMPGIAAGEASGAD